MPTNSRSLARAAVPLGLMLLAACAPAPRAAEVAPAPAVPATSAATAPDRDYLVFIASEATDRVSLVRFGPAGARIERELVVGSMPAEVDGPHGVAVSPDKRHVFVSTAHGTPFGYLWKYSADGGTVLGRTLLGNFPATMQVSPDGAFVYVVNFNLHGEMVPSSVSIVAAEEMVEVARVPTCTMPHGSRFNPQGTKQYSACMMDDMMVEIDARTLGASRHFLLTRGREHGESGPPHPPSRDAHAAHDAGGHGLQAPAAGDPTCSPTWAQPSADGARIFVACNKSSDIVEVDAERWVMTRRLPAGPGVYNLGVTHDGRLLIATNKRGQSVSVFDIAAGRELARIPTKRRVVHGVAVSADDRYAFISVEGVGSEPGTLEVIDLRALRTVATVDVGQMAGGIDVWKTEAAR
jgi:DNA-binding beta-propeller fold protein YncE